MMPVGLVVTAVVEIVVAPVGHVLPLRHTHTVKPFDEYLGL